MVYESARAIDDSRRNGQRTSTDEKDLPGRSFHHPSPFTMPVERPRNNTDERDNTKQSSA